MLLYRNALQAVRCGGLRTENYSEILIEIKGSMGLADVRRSLMLQSVQLDFSSISPPFEQEPEKTAPASCLLFGPSSVWRFDWPPLCGLRWASVFVAACGKN
jgi:hypothetical protein